MGNSTSTERQPLVVQSAEASETASVVTSPQDTPGGLNSSADVYSSENYFAQDVYKTHRARSVRSMVGVTSTESVSSLATAQHTEQASDISTATVEHAENAVDDIQFQQMKLSDNASDGTVGEDNTGSLKPVSKMLSGEEIDFYYGADNEQAVPITITWVHGGKKVYVTGTFTGWRKMIKLQRNGNEFSTVVNLPPGTHRIRFVVDNELRCSDTLPTATDSMGNLVNYIEVEPSELPELERESQLEEDKFEDSISVPPLEYTNEIPDLFMNPEASERYISEDYPAPPYLPPHLETVILNTNSTEKDDSSVLPIPNHVVLNHLATTSIKHNVLAVASVSRYARKYVTQILYAPL
ncbi:5'-AMP-activated protein kinase beta subunit, interation domain-containing protein [Lipomyces arxii]|uniref:5'-AMP-activated protein kinase beta subunit, interation domain-containing protein n=1 Tax=Lipomyces arxii TaxID=56418 RepID=UPI0034CE0039